MAQRSVAAEGGVTVRHARGSRRRQRNKWALLLGWPLGSARGRVIRRTLMLASVLLAAALAAWYPELIGLAEAIVQNPQRQHQVWAAMQEASQPSPGPGAAVIAATRSGEPDAVDAADRLTGWSRGKP